MEKNEETENKKDLKKYLLWIVDKRNYIFSVLSAVLLLNILVFKIKPMILKQPLDGLLLANQRYNDWKGASCKNGDKLDQLKSVIKKNPGLKPNYEGLILQNLLINENFGREENKLADMALERTKSELPLYYEFSKTAILINNGQLREALVKSRELKTKMLSDLSFLEKDCLPAGAVLYSFNLLRIALLEAKLNDAGNEYLAWQEFEDYLNLNSQNNANVNIKMALETIKQTFNENGIELADYIQYRKNMISAK